MTSLVVQLTSSACAPLGGAPRDDGARPIAIDSGPSLQNPCFMSAGSLLITRWLDGYNGAPAVVAAVEIEGGALEILTDADATSVNLPGACSSASAATWVFSSDVGGDHDEIFVAPLAAGPPVRITDRADAMAFEPSISPDGEWVVFESHPLDVEDQGALFKVRADGSELTELTDGSGDDRQPNWSPTGDAIVFQSHARVPGNIELFLIGPDGGEPVNLTDSPWEDTDASFSPDGDWVVYSSNEGDLALASLFVRPTDGGPAQRLTDGDGWYDGAPAWSPDGDVVAFEARIGDPDGSEGTALFLVDAP